MMLFKNLVPVILFTFLANYAHADISAKLSQSTKNISYDTDAELYVKNTGNTTLYVGAYTWNPVTDKMNANGWHIIKPGRSELIRSHHYDINVHLAYAKKDRNGNFGSVIAKPVKNFFGATVSADRSIIPVTKKPWKYSGRKSTIWNGREDWFELHCSHHKAVFQNQVATISIYANLADPVIPWQTKNERLQNKQQNTKIENTKPKATKPPKVSDYNNKMDQLPLAPLVDGLWVDLDHKNKTNIIWASNIIKQHLPNPIGNFFELTKMRMIKLDFYSRKNKDVYLFELMGSKNQWASYVIGSLKDPKHFVLDGTSKVLFEANKYYRINLTSKNNVLNYTKFFNSSIQSSKKVRILIDWSSNFLSNDKKFYLGIDDPEVVYDSKTKLWTVDSDLIDATIIYRTKFTVKNNGTIEMTESALKDRHDKYKSLGPRINGISLKNHMIIDGIKRYYVPAQKNQKQNINKGKFKNITIPRQKRSTNIK